MGWHIHRCALVARAPAALNPRNRSLPHGISIVPTYQGLSRLTASTSTGRVFTPHSLSKRPCIALDIAQGFAPVDTPGAQLLAAMTRVAELAPTATEPFAIGRLPNRIFVRRDGTNAGTAIRRC